MGVEILLVILSNLYIDFEDDPTGTSYSHYQALYAIVYTGQQDLLFGMLLLQIANGGEFLIRFGQLLRRALRVDEEGIDVDGLVVTDAGDVDAQSGEAPAGLQKRADVVGHVGNIGLLHKEKRTPCVGMHTV